MNKSYDSKTFNYILKKLIQSEGTPMTDVSRFSLDLFIKTFPKSKITISKSGDTEFTASITLEGIPDVRCTNNSKSEALLDAVWEAWSQCIRNNLVE